MKPSLTLDRVYQLATADARQNRNAAQREAIETLQELLPASATAPWNYAMAQTIRTVDCRDRAALSFADHLQAQQFRAAEAKANEVLERFGGRLSAINREEARWFRQESTPVPVPPTAFQAPDLSPIPLQVVLDPYERYRWMVLGAVTPAMGINAFSPMLPDFLIGTLALPLAIVGALWGDSLFRAGKEREVTKELASALAEVSRVVQRAAVRRVVEVFEKVESDSRHRWQDYYWTQLDQSRARSQMNLVPSAGSQSQPNGKAF